MGFLEGFLSDHSSDVDTCVGGALGPVADIKIGLDDLKQGFKQRNLTEIEEGVKSLHQVAQDLPAAKGCKVRKRCRCCRSSAQVRAFLERYPLAHQVRHRK